MRVAVILSGALRTIKKTVRYLKQNVLLNPEVHVFACVQNDTSTSQQEWTTWFNEQLGDHLKSMEWFSLDKHAEWITHRDAQLNHIQLSEDWKGYLRSSGSMIEYFQLQLAYMKMSYHEQCNGFLYEYIVRTRTDSIYAKPIDFHWLNWTDADVANRINKITEELVLSKIDATPQAIVRYFMNTMLSDDLISNIHQLTAEYAPCATEVEPVSLLELNNYIKNGRYILTIRKNNLYIVRRNLFYLIPTLGSMYGFLRSPYSDAYWFNAECQFRSACYHSCLTIFDYGTYFEERSLAYADSWNEATFFDLDGNVLNPRMLYCVVRK